MHSEILNIGISTNMIWLYHWGIQKLKINVNEDFSLPIFIFLCLNNVNTPFRHRSELKT